MPIYLANNTDVLSNDEGIGSLFQWDLLLKYIANHLGINHHKKFYDNVGHQKYSGFSKEDWNLSINSFFAFEDILYSCDKFQTLNCTEFNHEILNFIEKNKNSKIFYLINISDRNTIQSFCNENKNLLFSKNNIVQMKKSLRFNGNKYFDENINVAVHLRSINPSDVDFISSREYYDKDVTLTRVKNIIKFLNKEYKNQNINIHIYSQGKQEEFLYLEEMNTELIKFYFHINSHPIYDIFHMSNADILFMANSSFSYLAALMNENKVFARDNWWHFLPPNSQVVDYLYDNIIKEKNDK